MGDALPTQAFDNVKFHHEHEENWADVTATNGVVDIIGLIDKIRKTSSIFDGIPILSVKKLLAKTRCYEKGVVLIEERKRGIPCFYILLRWALDITLEWARLAELTWFQVFWEAWFVDEARMATVTVQERSYVIQVLKSEVSEMDYSAQAAIFSNLAHEVVKKMRWVNYSLAHKLLSLGTDKSRCKVHAGIESLI